MITQNGQLHTDHLGNIYGTFLQKGAWDSYKSISLQESGTSGILFIKSNFPKDCSQAFTLYIPVKQTRTLIFSKPLNNQFLNNSNQMTAFSFNLLDLSSKPISHGIKQVRIQSLLWESLSPLWLSCYSKELWLRLQGPFIHGTSKNTRWSEFHFTLQWHGTGVSSWASSRYLTAESGIFLHLLRSALWNQFAQISTIHQL